MRVAVSLLAIVVMLAMFPVVIVLGSAAWCSQEWTDHGAMGTTGETLPSDADSCCGPTGERESCDVLP